MEHAKNNIETAKSLINWHELSRLMTGKDRNIRPDRDIPKHSKKLVNRLLRILVLFVVLVRKKGA